MAIKEANGLIWMLQNLHRQHVTVKTGTLGMELLRGKNLSQFRYIIIRASWMVKGCKPVKFPNRKGRE
jgi:hypothetical protein